MMELLDLSPLDLSVLAVIAFAAGLVRGFAGFALSAVVMAAGVLILPPVALIPVCWVLEAVASALMVRGSIREADGRVVKGLVIGAGLGLPVGWALTLSVSVTTSSMMALGLVVSLAALQLARVRMAFLATGPGLYAAGIASGVVTGIASIGGMVVALYVLSQEAPARVMRATLVMYLLFGSVVSLGVMLWFGVFTTTSLVRGLVLAVPVACGVLLGKALFRPELERYYRPVCLSLLIGLAAMALGRLAL